MPGTPKNGGRSVRGGVVQATAEPATVSPSAAGIPALWKAGRRRAINAAVRGGIFAAAILATIPAARADGLFATLYGGPMTPAGAVALINPATAEFSTINADAPVLSDQNITRSTYDAANRVMYFMTSTAGHNAFLAVDLATGTIATRQLQGTLNGNPSVSLDAFEFDAASGRLLATIANGNDGAVVTIDPATGAFTNVNSDAPPISTQQITRSTYDAASRVMYFMTSAAGTSTFSSVDFATGTITAHTLQGTLNGNPSVLLDAFEFDPASGRLLATVANGNDGAVVTIDPATGAFTIVNSDAPPISTQLPTRSTYDAEERVMYFMTSAASTHTFSSVDFVTGTIVAHSMQGSLGGTQPFIDAFEYVADAPVQVPEPRNAALLITALAAFAVLLRRERRRPAAAFRIATC